jgi:hypothetical protein
MFEVTVRLVVDAPDDEVAEEIVARETTSFYGGPIKQVQVVNVV